MIKACIEGRVYMLPEVNKLEREPVFRRSNLLSSSEDRSVLSISSYPKLHTFDGTTLSK